LEKKEAYDRIKNAKAIYEKYKPEKIDIYKLDTSGDGKSNPNGSEETSILKILNSIQVTSTFVDNTEEKKVVVEKFQRFMCKYKIDEMIDSRIAYLYEQKRKKGKRHADLLEFIGSSEEETPSITDTFSNVVQQAKDILTTSTQIEEKAKTQK
jgi:hypothetical protein